MIDGNATLLITPLTFNIATRQGVRMREKAGRGWQEVGSGEGRRIYRAAAVLGEMAHRLSVDESDEGNAALIALCCSGGCRFWGQ